MLQGIHRRIRLPRSSDRRHSSWTRIEKESFKFDVHKYKTYGAHLLSIYLIRWRAFELSEGSSRNWRDTSVLVLSSKCGETMRVAITVSSPRTSRVARAQKGLMCPITHIEWIPIKKH